jgi:hypothetical protein
MLGKRAIKGEIKLPKTSFQKELEQEQAEIKTEIEKRINEFEKKKALIEFQYKQLKEEGRLKTSTVNVGWIAAFAYEVYGELISMYGAFGDIIDTLFELEKKTSKISGEWREHKRTLAKFKQAINFTEEMLSDNK